MQTPKAGGCEEFNSPLIFTKSEYKIIECSRQLMTNQEMADLLGIALVTVKTHRKNIMKKVGINGKAAMIRFVMTFKRE